MNEINSDFVRIDGQSPPTRFETDREAWQSGHMTLRRLTSLRGLYGGLPDHRAADDLVESFCRTTRASSPDQVRLARIQKEFRLSSAGLQVAVNVMLCFLGCGSTWRSGPYEVVLLAVGPDPFEHRRLCLSMGSRRGLGRLVVRDWSGSLSPTQTFLDAVTNWSLISEQEAERIKDQIKAKPVDPQS